MPEEWNVRRVDEVVLERGRAAFARGRHPKRLCFILGTTLDLTNALWIGMQ